MLGEMLCATTYEKLQKCEYLDAEARETLRLYPLASTSRYTTDPSAGKVSKLLLLVQWRAAAA